MFSKLVNHIDETSQAAGHIDLAIGQSIRHVDSGATATTR